MSTSARTTQGDLQLPRKVVTDFNSVVLQTVKDTLALWQAEWFLDQNAGFPWGTQILGRKVPDTAQINALLRQALLNVPGVVSLIATSTFKGSLRNFSYYFVAQLSNGQQLTGGSATPLQITGSP